MSTDLPNELRDEPYDSAEDEDFELDAAAQDDSDASVISDDEDAAPSKGPATKKRKLDSVSKDTETLELDSGDEATIRKAKRKKKQKKARKRDAEDEDEESDVEIDDEEEDGGQGGFVRTRAMRLRMQEEERKPLTKIDGATIDVDAIWAKMNALEPDGGSVPSQIEKENRPAAEEIPQPTGPPSEPTPETTDTKSFQYADEMIKIKRTYKFAGEIITEEKIVPKSSAEARVYLASGETADTVTAGELDGNPKSAVKLRRPLRKISRFDPNPTGSIKKSWEKQQQSMPGAGGAENVKGPKINVVDKSRLDWAAFVDQEGIKDDLVLASKAKEGYLGRMDFLGRVDAKREEERRNARLKGL